MADEGRVTATCHKSDSRTAGPIDRFKLANLALRSRPTQKHSCLGRLARDFIWRQTSQQTLAAYGANEHRK
jgi:hypothetical protein